MMRLLSAATAVFVLVASQQCVRADEKLTVIVFPEPGDVCGTSEGLVRQAWP
ncbi:MAG: hypothetical protein WBE29_01345 [Pseudolabrys sp.]